MNNLDRSSGYVSATHRATVSFNVRCHVPGSFVSAASTEAELREAARRYGQSVLDNAARLGDNDTLTRALGMVGLDLHDVSQGFVLVEGDGGVEIDLVPGEPGVVESVALVSDMANAAVIIPDLSKPLSADVLSLLGGMALAWIDRARRTCSMSGISRADGSISAERIVSILSRLATVQAGDTSAIESLAREAKAALGEVS
jgi:hypothetical protein